MHIEVKNINETQISVTVTAAEAELLPYKQKILNKMAPQVKMAGFRAGKAPISMVEKNIDSSTLQTEFLDEALTQLYSRAISQEKLRPVTKPEVTIKKFVPYTMLEFEVKTHAIPEIKLAKYRALKAKKTAVSVTTDDVAKVIESLKLRAAEKNPVERAAKKSDEAWIDFQGVNTKGEAVSGADGKDYPIVLGSDTFIPGFEDNIVGMKPGENKTFTLTFPKDYGVKALAGKKVTFTVSLKKVHEVNEPKVDDSFAAKVGPFKSVTELKEDIKKQLVHERQHEADRAYESELVKQIVDKTPVSIPEPLLEQQIIYNLDELRRNLTYRGQTYQEFLEMDGTTEDKYKNEILRPQAEQQIKTSLILAEIAEKENLFVTPEELEIRIQQLKGQYQDQQMQSELDKPENRNEIANRMLNEKVIQLISSSAS